MHRLTFFTKSDCSLCRSALFVLQRVRARVPFELEVVDISAPEHAAWRERYADHIPVVHLDGAEVFRHHVDERRLVELLG